MSDDTRKRFLRFVQLTNDCWLWTGFKGTKGYGMFSINHRSRRAHRVAYELFIGPIPTGMLVCHDCDNPGCVNPDHLYAGTQSDNIQDSVRKGRHSGLRYGERHSQARISNREVEEIRIRYKGENVSQQTLSREYGISQMHVSNILTGKRRGRG